MRLKTSIHAAAGATLIALAGCGNEKLDHSFVNDEGDKIELLHKNYFLGMDKDRILRVTNSDGDQEIFTHGKSGNWTDHLERVAHIDSKGKITAWNFGLNDIAHPVYKGALSKYNEYMRQLRSHEMEEFSRVMN